MHTFILKKRSWKTCSVWAVHKAVNRTAMFLSSVPWGSVQLSLNWMAKFVLASLEGASDMWTWIMLSFLLSSLSNLTCIQKCQLWCFYLPLFFLPVFLLCISCKRPTSSQDPRDSLCSWHKFTLVSFKCRIATITCKHI